jgi:cbb3-type cytochrome oxidase maturation protein
VESLYLLIPLGIIFVIIAIKILFWAINSGQYDNLDTEAHRILFDDDETSGVLGEKQSKSAPEDSGEEADPSATPTRNESSHD